MTRFYTWLDTAIFPRIVAYATHPLVILLTICLIVPLVVFSSVTALALVLGNYTNVVSAAVSSIVLMQALKHHHEAKQMHRQTHTLLQHLKGGQSDVNSADVP